MDEEARELWPVYGLLIWFVQLGVAAVASFFVLFRRIEVPHCELKCDFGLLDQTGNVFVIAATVLAGLCGLALLLFRFRTHARRHAYLVVPTLGIFLTVAGAFVACRLSDMALLYS